MCGIAGVISVDGPITDRDYKEAWNMTAMLVHRGPDTIDVVRTDDCALGNTRLKIIDLTDNAHLPMSNEDGTVWIVYNGEVTNFQELRRDFHLDDRHEFKSTSDSEVLIHLYEEIGIELLQHLSGYFTLGLYDQNKKKAYVVRDFYGVRPLFFMHKHGRVFFSSEIKSFFETEAMSDALDHEGLFHYFSLAYIPDHHTPFADIHELDGGWLLEIDLKTHQVKEREYYEIKYNPDYSKELQPTADEVRGMLRDSVRRNMISDAPVGMTLSGGFDTSTMLALLKDLGYSKEVHTFSIVMDEPSFDESFYQHLMVDFAKPIHHEIRVGPNDIMGAMVQSMAYLDEPTGDGAAIPTFLLAQDAKEYVRVLLSGEGGDEVFNAYETHGAYAMRKLYRKLVPKLGRKAIRALVERMPSSYRKLSIDFLLKRFTEGAEMDVPEAHLFWRYTLTDQDQRELMPRHNQYMRTDRFFRRLYDKLDFDDDLNRLSVIDMKYFFIGDLMVKNDRMFMAHSIEGRFPFMDRLLIEFVSTIPPDMRMTMFGLNRRYIQKQAMKGYIPQRILVRNNMGLELPHSLWLMDMMQSAIKHYFTKSQIEKSGLLSYKKVMGLWDEHLQKRRDNGRALWAILQYMLWFDLFVYHKSYKDYHLTSAPTI